jgi:hypothetical protein
MSLAGSLAVAWTLAVYMSLTQNLPNTFSWAIWRLMILISASVGYLLLSMIAVNGVVGYLKIGL